MNYLRGPVDGDVDNSRGLVGTPLPQGFEVVLVDKHGLMHIGYKVRIDGYKYTVGCTIALRASEGRLRRLMLKMMYEAMQQHAERILGNE